MVYQLYSIHDPEAMVIVGRTPESLELAMDIKSGDLSCYSFWQLLNPTSTLHITKSWQVNSLVQPNVQLPAEQ